MGHVVLLGDSIFDNGAYVTGAPDVRTQLEETLPVGWEVTLLAVDGDTVAAVHGQLDGIPDDATHLVLSVGGNDALGYMPLLEQPVASIGEAILFLSRWFVDFERKYADLVREILGHNLPTAVCTIYFPRFGEPALQEVACTALSLFNDCIIRQAVSNCIPVLDLRAICDQDDDYANPIEPSSRGGAKIAGAIARLVLERDFNPGRTRIFV